MLVFKNTQAWSLKISGDQEGNQEGALSRDPRLQVVQGSELRVPKEEGCEAIVSFYVRVRGF